MSRRKTNTKSFNPQLLILTGPAQEREWLLDMGKIITSVGSFSIVAEIEQVIAQLGVVCKLWVVQLSQIIVQSGIISAVRP